MSIIDIYFYLVPVIGRSAAEVIVAVIALIWLIVILGFPIFALISWFRMRRHGVTTETPRADRRAKLDTRTLRVNYLFYVLGRWALLLILTAGTIFMNVMTAVWMTRLLIWATNQLWFIPVSLLVVWRLYAARVNYRFGYGSVEVFIGVAAVIAGVLKPAAGDAEVYLHIDDLSHALAVIGGIYVVVRGLVDMEEGTEDILPRLSPSNQRRLQGFWSLLRH
jgi:hypothetical protein